MGRVASWALWALFPGFFFWHFAVGYGAPIPAIGWWAEISGLTLVAVVAVATVYFSRATFTPYLLVASIFVAYCSAWSVAHLLIGAPIVTFTQAATVIGSWIVLLALGLFFNPGRKAIAAFTLSWGAMAIIILTFREGVSFNPSALFGAENISTYQGFSRSLMVTSIVLLSVIQRPGARIALSAATVALLFLTIARSEFAAFTLTMFVIEVARGIRKPIGLAILCGWGLIGLLGVTAVFDVIAQSRQLQLFDLSHATSWIGRKEYYAVALEQIMDSPLLGYFGGHYIETREIGGYAHNALSAWVSFGALGFVIYVGLTAWAAIRSGLWMMGRPTERQCLSAYLNISALILIMTAKSIFWPVVALGWGVYAAARREDRARKRAMKRERSIITREPKGAAV